MLEDCATKNTKGHKKTGSETEWWPQRGVRLRRATAGQARRRKNGRSESGEDWPQKAQKTSACAGLRRDEQNRRGIIFGPYLSDKGGDRSWQKNGGRKMTAGADSPQRHEDTKVGGETGVGDHERRTRKFGRKKASACAKLWRDKREDAKRGERCSGGARPTRPWLHSEAEFSPEDGEGVAAEADQDRFGAGADYDMASADVGVGQ